MEPARFGEALAAWGQPIEGGDEATRRYQVALSRLPWAQRHRRLMGLADARGSLLAVAARHELRGTLDGAPVRVCIIGELAHAETPTDGEAAMLVEQLVEEAAVEGLDAAIVLGPLPVGLTGRFSPVPTTHVGLRVIESQRRGAPMAPVRSGERTDMALIAAIPPMAAGRPGLRLERDHGYVDFMATRRRLRAGLAPDGVRQTVFLVVEEGMRPAAHLLLSVCGTDWVVDYCGDHDPTGARVGAILQTLIAREPAERRPDISAWLPDDIVPPQVAVLSSVAAADAAWISPLGGSAWPSAPRVGLWRGDLP